LKVLQTQFDEAFLQIENIDPERKDDWQEVQNYTQAINNAIEELNHFHFIKIDTSNSRNINARS